MYYRLTSLQWDLQVIPNWNFKNLVGITYIRIESGPLSKMVEHACSKTIQEDFLPNFDML